MTDQTTAPKSRRGLTLTIIVVAVVLLLVFWGVGQYNSLVVLDEQVNTSWSQVENQYQRRADLIPNLVETVKGYASHERETLEGVINARAKASQPIIQAGDGMTQEQLNQFQQAQGDLTSALNRLMVVVERYPELKADENFRQLQAQLEGTENRITTARMDFNNEAQQYNTKVRRFPTNIFAGLFGFHQRPYFQTEAGAEQAPQVKF
ncbi:LemA family protein [Porphyromonas uenonis 60-3]|uniref:LemA family protein n=1 Tax=Porphyromonas uenonis 60-3 TaxID=596327 RepID=C2MCD9_9PORP|nr:LemA family protein [Porphyromonas uenonis]EEK16645.1 LemA family protein [Porphyromonas uenonis 60-3]